MNLDNAERGTNDIINAGAEITGSAIAGGTSGFLLGGPVGGLAGAAAGGATPLLKHCIIRIVGDIAERSLSEREKIRIGGVINYAAHKIQEKLNAGEKLRSDDFFQKPTKTHAACAEIAFAERPASQEVLEGILLATQREHEEKKIPFLGNLLANFAFRSDIDSSQANMLIKLGKGISYRQMCLLSLFENSEKFRMRDKDYSNSILYDEKKASLLQEIYALEIQDLLIYPEHVVIGSSAVNPSKMKLQLVGYMLYSLMELSRIDDAELDLIASMLQ